MAPSSPLGVMTSSATARQTPMQWFVLELSPEVTPPGRSPNTGWPRRRKPRRVHPHLAYVSTSARAHQHPSLQGNAQHQPVDDSPDLNPSLVCKGVRVPKKNKRAESEEPQRCRDHRWVEHRGVQWSEATSHDDAIRKHDRAEMDGRIYGLHRQGPLP